MASGSEAVRVEVAVADEQHDVAVDAERYGRLLADALAAEGVDAGEATLTFVDRDAMAELNEAHMGKDGPTDVLSFPIDGADRLRVDEHRMVGDVVVCAAVARDQAPDHAGDLDGELALLIVHGALHLCGHDHAEADERDRMWRRERELLDTLWGPMARDAWVT
jgi:probable rRNA maturation factor